MQTYLYQTKFIAGLYIFMENLIVGIPIWSDTIFPADPPKIFYPIDKTIPWKTLDNLHN